MIFQGGLRPNVVAAAEQPFDNGPSPEKTYLYFENHWETPMAWDFETDPEFQKKLDWIEDFMAEEVEPLSHLGMAVYGGLGREKFIKPLQQKVKDQGLWACHLRPELGGQGYGQLKLG